MNEVSDITFPRPLSTQDKHFCCMVIATKKKGKRRKERKKEEKEGWKYKRKYYILLAERMDIVVFQENSTISMHNAQ